MSALRNLLRMNTKASAHATGVSFRIWAVAAWRRRTKPILAVTAGGLLLLLLFLPAWKRTDSRSTHSAYYPVNRSDFLISIVEGGTIKAVHEETVRSQLEGVARIISIAPEGAFVKKGDLLVELDSADLRERISSQEVVYQNTRFAVLQSKEYLSIQKSVTESNIKDAELKLEFAATDLQKYKEGDWPQLKKNSETKIKIAKMELGRAHDRLNWTEQLHKKGYASRSELDVDTLAVEKAEIGVDQSQEELRLLEKFDAPKKIRQLEAALEQAGKELDRIKQRSAAQIAQAEADLEAKSTGMELQETRHGQLKAQLELTKIQAPEAGLVVYASSSNPGNGVLIEEGANIRQKQDIIKLPDITQMMIEIRVHESHVQKIRPGLTAYVTIDSFPDNQFKGTVRKVAVLPDSTSRYFNPNLKVYTTEIVIEDELPDLKPGISGRAEIVITNLNDVLTVPIQAVTTVKGRQVCFIERGGATVPIPVEVGLYNEKYIEIKSGLKEGDQVLLSPLGSSDNINLSGSMINAEGKDSSAQYSRKPGLSTNAPHEERHDTAGQNNREPLRAATTNLPPLTAR
jgi:HlyD family secretion protein